MGRALLPSPVHVLAAVRARCSLDDLAGYLPSWAGGYLRGWAEMAHRFAPWPGAVEAAARLGDGLAFDLQLIAPALPPFPVPTGHGDEMAYLRELTFRGAERRYGPRGPDTEKAYRVIEHALAIIGQLGYPGYFLVVWELVEYCRAEGILCQGRGSAANSAVCYALGVTAVDAVKHGLLFERFLSPERDGPPDIDVDIESDLRELVI
jgi:error-prone DNA polymerase